MIRAAQIKVKIEHTTEDIKKALLKALKIQEEQLKSFEIVRKSIDARKKEDIYYVYTLDVVIEDESRLLKRNRQPNITPSKSIPYHVLKDGMKHLKHRPVIVGSGPAGMFCALLLAEQGFKPLLLERGDMAAERVKKVEHFWSTNELDLESNVQFGEGGAGTFSDGKLNTLVKDPLSRGKKVLEEFVNSGAPSEIMYLNKPHIGTDKLRDVVTNMRKRIVEYGGEVRFHTKLTDILVENQEIKAIEVNHGETIPCQVLITAIGHSARDTFELMHNRGVVMHPKSFAVGIRMEHPQIRINESQYGKLWDKLPPAEYKLTHTAASGRGIYSFCMCPGGFVVNSSSEQGGLVVNGMSNYKRDEENANSALIVTVTPEDFKSSSPLAGVAFQREWEAAAYDAGKGFIPVQRYGDFKMRRPAENLQGIKTCMKGAYTGAALWNCLPEYVSHTLIEGIEAFDKKIRGFADPEAILSGVETRTSSPVRITRNLDLESNISGLYPCGEGAGYAGGITSAAMDGLKVAESILHAYKADY